MRKFKFKVVRDKGKIFLLRLTVYLKNGSFKVHLILDDDSGFHSHPWDFGSLILFGGYNEISHSDSFPDKVRYISYKFGDYNLKSANTRHWVSLRKIFNIKIPALTVGFYGEKTRLCSYCSELGYCKTNKTN